MSRIEGFAKDINMGGRTLCGSYDGSNGVPIRQSPHMQLFGSQQAFSVSPLVSGLTFEQVKKCNDRENEDSRPFSSASSLSSSSTNTTSKSKSSTTTSNTMGNATANVDITPPPALEDGFSPDEIAQFAQLLCSPKKAPPVRYQCHICYRSGHYISDCPMRFNSPYEELTPYQGRKKCYGEFQCQQCKRKWTSQNSVANEAQSCIKCHVPVFPHKQLPVDKAVALGLIKAQHPVPTKMSPIGHGRPPFGEVPVRL
ncbi:Zinc knuckle family protein [Aphelenchoides avenae]|nr:Zinc knuckle family protein [Aphelenchus avenae]